MEVNEVSNDLMDFPNVQLFSTVLLKLQSRTLVMANNLADVHPCNVIY